MFVLYMELSSFKYTGNNLGDHSGLFHPSCFKSTGYISIIHPVSVGVYVNLKHLLKSLIKNTRQYYETFLLHSIKEWTFPISKITSFLGFHSLVFTAIFNAIITFYILWHFTSLFNNYIYTGLSSLKILS